MNQLRTAATLILFLVGSQSTLANGAAYSEGSVDGGCGPAWTAHAEWLYWNVRATDLDYALRTSGIDIESPVYDIDPSYSSGLPLGLQRHVGRCSLDFAYTYYAASEEESVGPPGIYAGTLLVPRYTDVNQSSIRFAAADWGLDYHLFDLAGGYTFFRSDCVEGSIFGGFRAALIDEQMTTLYRGSAPAPQPSPIDLIERDTDMSAYGVNFGLRGKCWMGCLGSVTASCGFSPLVANFHRRFFYTGSSNGGASFTTDADILEETTRMLGVFNLALGYEMLLFQNEICDATLGVGYEFQQWVNFPGLLKHTNETDEITLDHHVSNLGIDGANVALTLSY